MPEITVIGHTHKGGMVVSSITSDEYEKHATRFDPTFKELAGQVKSIVGEVYNGGTTGGYLSIGDTTFDIKSFCAITVTYNE